jgi:hypothetical protein
VTEKNSVLDYWLACVREQDIQKTSLGSNLNSHQFVSLDDEGLLLSNQRDSVKILLTDALRTILKKERTRQMYRNNKDSRPVFFFPLVVINNQTLPLFYVDLVDLEERIVTGKGELSFEINPWSVDTKIGVVSDTFVKLGYDEENIDMSDSVIGFIEKITGQFTLNFQLALKELLDFILLESKSVSNPISKVSEIRNIGIIKYSDFSEATLVFKKDLLFIKENPSLYNSTIIDSYISLRSSGVEFTEKPFVGGFFDFPISKGQSVAVSEIICSNREIVSVQGGPGTGKTTLILSTIASILTGRALSLARGEEKDLGFLLVTSFTNKAVDNVANIIESQYGEKFSNWLYIQLGNREKRTLASGRISLFINQIESECFDRSLYEKLKVFLIESNDSLISSSNQVDNVPVSYSRKEVGLLKAYGYKGNFDNETLTLFLTNLLKVKDNSLSSAISSLNYSIKNDTSTLEKLAIQKIISERKISFYQDIKKKYPELSTEILHGKVKYADKSSVVSSKNLPLSSGFNFVKRILLFMGFNLEKEGKIITRSKNIFDKEIYVINKISSKGYEEYSACKAKFEKINSRSNVLEARLSKKKTIRAILSKVSSSTTTTSSLEKSRLNNVGDHKSIFEASLHFMYQHILKNKADIIDSLMAWDSVIQGKGTENHNYHNDFRSFVSDISLPFPVLGCTLSSLGNIFDHNESTFINNKPFELSICDEAGMVPIFCMPSILMRSKRSLVIGDQKQLPPIINIDKNRLIEFKNRYKLKDEGNIYNPMMSSAFQRSAFAKISNFSEIGESVILDEHRRCQRVISDCFIDIGGYSKITNHTPVLEDEDKDHYDLISKNEIILYDVKGGNKGKRNTNTEEIERIKDLLFDLEDKGFDIKSQVGIITPFQNQSILLQSEFRRLLGHNVNDKKIGTVHAFQGAEYDIIILSLVAFNKSFHVQFVTKSPNLLNVAISRARNRLIVVGDKDFLEEQDGNLRTLLKYAELTSSSAR